MGQALVAALETTDNAITLPLGLDWRVLGFAGGLAVATCLLFGLAPALRGTRMAATAVMRASTRGATASRDSLRFAARSSSCRWPCRSRCCSVPCCSRARSTTRRRVDPGFEPDGLLAAQFNFRARRRAGGAREAATGPKSSSASAPCPASRSAAFAAIVPISGDSSGNDVWPDGAPGQRFNMSNNTVGPGFFATMGVPLLAGRDFDDRDVPESPPVAIVDEMFAATIGGAEARSAGGSRAKRRRAARRRPSRSSASSAARPTSP